MAFVAVWLMCLCIMYLNSPQSIVPGTKNFFLSMSGRSDREAFSQITGMRSGYLARIRRASALRFSKGTDSWRAEAAICSVRFKGRSCLGEGVKDGRCDAAKQA